MHELRHDQLPRANGPKRSGCVVRRWFAARIGRVKVITFGTFAHVTARHDMSPSAVSALIALLHASLECITVLGERASHGMLQVGTPTSLRSWAGVHIALYGLPHDGEGLVLAARVKAT